ncbi:hypothetical protein [Nocardioides sp.]|jgi:hypothetical protein|uniref:hypothetical protein n=1 Tax=Nocardioides sp. TaxID=35761 RepID=UPI002620665E|nr:hypothetical protein [Nocardioides sp.]
MPRLRSRAVVAALGAGLVLPALATLPSQAAIGSASFTLADCDVILNPAAENQVVSSNGTWSTSLTVDHPSPVPVESSQTIGFELGEIPANTFPEALDNAGFVVYLEFENGTGFSQNFETEDVGLGTFDPTQPLVLGETEVDGVTYFDSGRFPLGLKGLSVAVYGNDTDPAAEGAFRDYRYECDRPTIAIPVVEFGVFDPTRDATITLDTFQATQGQSIGIDGRDFAALTTNGTVTPTVGGEPANTFPVDDIGFFDGQLVVPEFAPPGQQEVRATYQGESATALITIVAKKAQLVVTKAVKAGKTLAVNGSLFKPGEKVTLKLKKKGPAKKGTKKAFGSSVTADANGQISKAVKLKKAAKGTWKITAKGAESGRTAASGFKVS